MFFRDENGSDEVAYRLEDAPSPRASPRPRLAAAIASIAAFSSSSPTTPSNEPRTTPDASTVNTHGSVRMPHVVDGLDRLELVVRVEDRLEAALGVGELVRLDVDEHDVVGESAATALIRSRVGPHWALLQNAGVANTSTNGSFAASASLTVVS